MTFLRSPERQLLALIVVCSAGFMLYGFSCYVWSTGHIVERRDWPTELDELVKESAKEGDSMKDIDVRTTGAFFVHVWKMTATDSRLRLHSKKFNLAAVALSRVEQKRILSKWPQTWSNALSDYDAYANPNALRGAAEGEYEFILLHDKGTATLYFYSYFSF